MEDFLFSVFDDIYNNIMIEVLNDVERYFNNIKDDFILKNIKLLSEEDKSILKNSRIGYNYNSINRIYGISITKLSEVTISTYVHPLLLEEVSNNERMFNDFIMFKDMLEHYIIKVVGKNWEIPDFLKKYDKTVYFKRIDKLYPYNIDQEYYYMKNTLLYYQGLKLII